ncbi:hypothetical protein [Actinomadura keratinilytica]|uniref:hypothetical protein n=1 Tax=Actinomadura keratinilytica TaxID=547461 RepID=UPI0031E6C82B
MVIDAPIVLPGGSLVIMCRHFSGRRLSCAEKVHARDGAPIIWSEPSNTYCHLFLSDRDRNKGVSVTR